MNTTITINGLKASPHPSLRCPCCGGLVWRPHGEDGEPNEAYGWRCCNNGCEKGRSPFATYRSDGTPWVSMHVERKEVSRV